MSSVGYGGLFLLYPLLMGNFGLHTALVTEFTVLCVRLNNTSLKCRLHAAPFVAANNKT